LQAFLIGKLRFFFDSRQPLELLHHHHHDDGASMLGHRLGAAEVGQPSGSAFDTFRGGIFHPTLPHGVKAVLAILPDKAMEYTFRVDSKNSFPDANDPPRSPEYDFGPEGPAYSSRGHAAPTTFIPVS
jgi:hypothetical protein